MRQLITHDVTNRTGENAIPIAGLPDRQLLDAAPDAMVVVDQCGGIVLVNQQTERLFGYSRNELLGQSMEILLPDHMRAHHSGLREQFFKHPRVRPMGNGATLFGRRKDGSEFPVEISLSPVLADQATYVASAIRDVTKKLERNERRFRAIFDQRHQLSSVLDLAGVVIDVNEHALSFSGLNRADVIGKPFWKTGWWTHSVGLQKQLKDAIDLAASGEIVCFEATHPRPDGTLATVDFSVRPVKDDIGETVFLVPESHDITERKRAEHALIIANEDLEKRVLERIEDAEAARREAERADVGKSQFLAAASHDLRQPLQSLGLYLSVLTQQLEDSQLKLLGDKMRKSLDTMGELLDALLDISKLDGGSIKPCKRDVRLQVLLDRIVTDTQQQADGKGLQLSCTRADCVIHSDPGLLERVLENFVTNAIRYTDKGEVSIDCQCGGDTAKISVTDTGIGIPEHHLPSIFDEYYQLDNPARQSKKGLGLGLSIVKKIARLLDHAIDVQSTPGEGSVFSIEVPLGAAAETRQAPPTTNAKARTRDPVVLFIDDDPAIVDATAMLMEASHINIHCASSGEAALAHLAAGVRPDIVVSDFRLPGYNGVEVVRRVRAATDDNLPGILITGDTSGYEIKAANLTNCAVLHKPVDTNRLIELIENYAVTRSAGNL